MKLLPVVPLLACLILIPLSAEENSATFGGTARFDTQIGAGSGQNVLSLPYARGQFEPKATFNLQGLDFVADASLIVDNLGTLEPTVHDAYMSAMLWEVVQCRIGRFAYQPGAALLFSNVEFFGSLDPLAILTSGLGAKPGSDDLIQLKYLGTGFFVGLTVTPLAPVRNLVPAASAWFPRGGIRDSWELLGVNYQLRKLEWISDAKGSWGMFDPAWSLDAGINVGGLDAAVFFFDGADRRYAVSGAINLPASAFGVYDLTLTPVSSRVQRLGATASYQADAFRFWLDGAWSWNRMFSSNDLYGAANGFRTGTTPADGLDWCAGISWNLPIASAFLALEWRHSWYPDGVNAPLLEKAVAFMASAEFFEGKMATNLVSIVSLLDYSFCIVPTITFRIGDHDLDFRCPLFFGNSTTEFGQYANLHRVFASVVLKF